MAIRALVTARLPRHATTARFAAAAHLQQLQQSAIARAAAFSTSSSDGDDEDAVVAPVVEENGVISSIPIAQVCMRGAIAMQLCVAVSMCVS